MGKRAQARPDYSEVCPNLLLSHGNVTCILEDLRAILLIRLHHSLSGKARMKLAKPCFWSAARAYVLRMASPFTRRFDEVTLRVVQSGMMSRWWLEYSSISKNMSEAVRDEDEVDIVDELKDTSYKGTFFFVLVGNAVSFCVFIGELLIFWCWNNPGCTEGHQGRSWES